MSGGNAVQAWTRRRGLTRPARSGLSGVAEGKPRFVLNEQSIVRDAKPKAKTEAEDGRGYRREPARAAGRRALTAGTRQGSKTKTKAADNVGVIRSL